MKWLINEKAAALTYKDSDSDSSTAGVLQTSDSGIAVKVASTI